MQTINSLFRSKLRRMSHHNSIDLPSVSDLTDSASFASLPLRRSSPEDGNHHRDSKSRLTTRSHRLLRHISSLTAASTNEQCIVQGKPAFVLPLLNAADTSELLAVSGDLGPDQSSVHFAKRTKSIAFVLSIGGTWFQINQDFFNQAPKYNDFSGGYKRFYSELPRSFIQSAVTQRLLTSFATVYGIQDGEMVLAQVQSSNISAEDEGKCLTGQGIHSDGADRAMLVCLERDNVRDARSSVYEDVDGERPIVDRHTLQEGEVLFWKDNQVYHYVEPAKLEDKEREGTRTVLIAHYPAMHYISGKTNPSNNLPPSGKHPNYMKQ